MLIENTLRTFLYVRLWAIQKKEQQLHPQGLDALPGEEVRQEIKHGGYLSKACTAAMGHREEAFLLVWIGSREGVWETRKQRLQKPGVARWGGRACPKDRPEQEPLSRPQS